jgi:sec-independent protein translocase protein TatB
MFDIGFWEMLVIAVMALIILGPERLPGAIRSTMNTIRSIKDVANGFKQEVTSQLDAHELHTNLKKAEDLGMKNLGKDLQDSVNELKAAAASVQQPYKKKAAAPAPEKSVETNKNLTENASSNTISEATKPPVKNAESISNTANKVRKSNNE